MLIQTGGPLENQLANINIGIEQCKEDLKNSCI